MREQSYLATALAFAAGGLVGGVAAVTYVKHDSWWWRRAAHAAQAVEEQLTEPVLGIQTALEDDILAEHFTRNTQFFGAAAQEDIMKSFVIVVGLGGVGSHAAHLLLRSGVGRLRLIDFDQVTLSSLNRHAVATRADVGTSKAKCLTQHFQQVVPEAQIEAVNMMYSAESENELLEGSPDFVIDAIDNIDTKVALLAACHRRNIPVLCVAGAGAKADPTRIRFADVAESTADALSRAVRLRLRREYGIDRGVPVLLSTEKPRCGLVPIEEGANPLDYQIVPSFRVRTIPVLGTMPAIFGMSAAAWVLCRLAGQPFQGEPLHRLTAKQYETMLQRLVESDELEHGPESDVQVDVDDVAYLLRELWRGRSARSHLEDAQAAASDKGLARSLAGLCLLRWDEARPACLDNLVLLSFAEAEAHRVAGLAAVRQHQPEFAARVDQLLARARVDHGL